jgi:hypothetical protein
MENCFDSLLPNLAFSFVNGLLIARSPELFCTYTGGNSPHIGGSTFYGDNVEDEWFIVSLLVELSKEFQDVVIRYVASNSCSTLIGFNLQKHQNLKLVCA